MVITGCKANWMFGIGVILVEISIRCQPTPDLSGVVRCRLSGCRPFSGRLRLLLANAQHISRECTEQASPFLTTDNLDRELPQNVYENPTLGSTGSWYTSALVTRSR